MTAARSIVRAVTFAIAFVAVYVLLIRVETGQYIDAESFGAFDDLHGSLGGAAKIYRVAAPIVLAAAALACGIVALVRRRVVDTVRAALIPVVSFGLGEVLKLALPRPDLGGYGYADNTFPSGHLTITLSLAVAVAVLVPPRSRRVVAPLVMLASIAAGWASVVSYAHRPSDVLGGALLVGFVASLVLWRRRTVLDARPIVTVAMLLLVAASVTLVVLSMPAPGSDTAAVAWLAIGAAVVLPVALSIPVRDGDLLTTGGRRPPAA